MGYLKMTLSSGDVKTILADGIVSIEDGSGATHVDIKYTGATSSTHITKITASAANDRDAIKVAVRAALVKYLSLIHI